MSGTAEAPGRTPTSIELRRKEASCVLTVSKDGFEPTTYSIIRSLSGWYLGNILIGGVIGFIVDAADGAMFTLDPDDIMATLVPSAHAVIVPTGKAIDSSGAPLSAPTHRVKIFPSSEAAIGCRLIGTVDTRVPCPTEYTFSRSKCLGWRAAMVGGNAIVDAPEPLAYDCPEPKKKE